MMLHDSSNQKASGMADDPAFQEERNGMCTVGISMNGQLAYLILCLYAFSELLSLLCSLLLGELLFGLFLQSNTSSQCCRPNCQALRLLGHIDISLQPELLAFSQQTKYQPGKQYAA